MRSLGMLPYIEDEDIMASEVPKVPEVILPNKQNEIKYRPWSKQDRLTLRKLIKNGITDVEELARLMNRTTRGIKTVGKPYLRKNKNKKRASLQKAVEGGI